MINLRSLSGALPVVGPLVQTTRALGVAHPLSGSAGSSWRFPMYQGKWMDVWPNYTEHLTHRRHRNGQNAHTYGLQKMSLLNVVDNSSIGRQAMANGLPPKIIHVYSRKHAKKSHGAYAKLGDRVLLAVCGQKKKGIIVGMRQKQLHGVPRFDSNNVVLIEENGSPTGTRITAPLPMCIRPGLQQDSNPKKADYTKLFAIATKWV